MPSPAIPQGVEDSNAAEIVKKLDVDGDGEVSEEEFVAGFKHFVTGQLKSDHEDDAPVHRM